MKPAKGGPKGPAGINGGGGNGGGGGFRFKLKVDLPVADEVIRRELATFDPDAKPQPDRSHLTDEQSETMAAFIRTASELEQVIHIAAQTATFGGVGSSVTVGGVRYMVRTTDHELTKQTDGGTLILWSVNCVPIIDQTITAEDLADFEDVPDIVYDDIADTADAAHRVRDEDIADDVRDHESDDRGDSIDGL